jgi:GAF domain-containing protein
MIVKEDPDPALARRVPDLPLALVEIVERAMRKSPHDRFASMREVRAALVAAHPDAAAVADDAEPALPESESQRLGAVQKWGILDSQPEPVFDDLTLLAARTCGAPFALMSFVSPERVWVKSSVGGARFEDHHGSGFCAHAILGRDVMVVPDATADSRFRDNPWVSGEPGVKFYAGAPLVTPEGLAIGTLSVLDREPRELSPEQCQALRILAAQVMAQLELRRRRRHETERSGEKLLLEVAGLSDGRPPEGGDSAHG